MEEYYVYWYKRPHFIDPFTEGYIGITNNCTRRNLEHRRGTKNLHITNALNKHLDIEMVILHNCSALEALELEQSYRPIKNIGWNMAAGGEDTLASWGKTPISVYHQDSYPILHSFESVEKASIMLGIKADRLTMARTRGRQIYGKDGWAILIDHAFDRTRTPTYNDVIGKGIRGLKRSVSSHFKGKTDRWSEEERLRIGLQHKGKTISEEQRKHNSEFHKLNNPACKKVTLSHEDNPNKIHNFRSIGEASRELGISRSALKYRARQPLPITGKDGWTLLTLGSE